MRTFTLVEEEEEEEEAEAGDQEVLFKHVFDNLRNTLICAALALAGAGIVKYREDLELFDSAINATVGILLILTSFFLCGWNTVDGYKKILLPARGATKAGLYILASLIYGFLAFAGLQAGAMFQPKQLQLTSLDIMAGREDPPAFLTLTLDCSLDPEAECSKSVVLVSDLANQEIGEDRAGLSVDPSLIEGYEFWPDARASLGTFDYQIPYRFTDEQVQ